MLRIFFLLTIAGVFLATSFGASLPVKQGRCGTWCKLNRLDKKIEDLTKRVNGANVQCIDKSTNFDLGADSPLVYLDRQHVACPFPYFLASFRLNRHDFGYNSKIRYVYKCCKFVL